MQFKSQDRLGRDTNILRGEKETDYVNVPRLKEVKPKQQLLVTILCCSSKKIQDVYKIINIIWSDMTMMVHQWWSISDGHQFFINSLDGHHIFKSDEMGWWTIKFLTISPSPSIYKLPSKSGLLSKNGGFFRKIWAVTLFKIGVAINWRW